MALHYEKSISSFPLLYPVDNVDKSVHNYATTLFSSLRRKTLANTTCEICVINMLKTCFVLVKFHNP